ncbi:alpha/beta fold hydrolase [Micropruina sonneratiae]|uniref:alpha/beta fold hydrolase n=1 Tax=Micropruina sonneratiae TaxID=2986940 RepID=UPI002227F36A|nr:alpha/beta hydrolase [Micropruina sp. KQZ13P-5]MCW3159579.1 alpha/beta hydrolase [Micropruina sp. KQZ13P-5]
MRTLDRSLHDGTRFSLAYTRTGAPSDRPILVFPGGPGLASVVPYAALRRRAMKMGLDVIMMEHRGVGLSRTDENGTDLPRSSITIRHVLDDAAAVLDAENVEQVIVYGSSYGSYLAQASVRRSQTASRA